MRGVLYPIVISAILKQVKVAVATPLNMTEGGGGLLVYRKPALFISAAQCDSAIRLTLTAPPPPPRVITPHVSARSRMAERSTQS